MLVHSRKKEQREKRKDTYIRLHEAVLLGNYLLRDKKTVWGEQGTLAARSLIRLYNNIPLSGMRETNTY
jgi:hypothetical protein